MQELFDWARKQNYLYFSVDLIQRFANGKKTGVFFYEATWLDKPEEGMRSSNRERSHTVEGLKNILMKGTAPVEKKSGGLL